MVTIVPVAQPTLGNQPSPSAVIEDVQTALQSIANLQNRSVFVYDDSDLQDKIKTIRSFPAVGVIYDGMRSVGDDSPKGHTQRKGVSAELVISLVFIMQPETIIKSDAKTPVIDLMNTVRSMMIGKLSPTGHQYRFVLEAPAALKNGMAFWVQRWAVPIQFPPAPGN